MAYIVEFAVSGLAGRKGVYCQKLNRDVNVFFGLNGSGKTSLLTILHSALRGYGSMLRKVPFQEATVKIYSVDYDQVFTRTTRQQPLPAPRLNQRALFGEGEVTVVEGTEEMRYLEATSEAIVWETEPAKGSESRWSHRYLPTSRLWVSPDVQSRLRSRDVQYHLASGLDEDVAVVEERLNTSFQESLERLWAGYVREVLSKVRKTQEQGLANILREVLSAERAKPKGTPLDSETAFDRVQMFLARQGARAAFGSKAEFKKHYARNTILKNVVSHINEVELGIENAMAPRDKLGALISKMFSGGKKVVLTDKSIEVQTTDQSQISVASLSSGEKHALRILIEMLYAEQGPLLIDEPEISMHVDWQRELIPSMQSVNKDAQLILATHSPEILAPVDDGNIFRL